VTIEGRSIMKDARLLMLVFAGLALAALAGCAGDPATENEVARTAPEEGIEPPPPPPPSPPPSSVAPSRPQRTEIPEEREAAPAPRKPSPPPTVTLTVPEGTGMTVAFASPLTSATAAEGDDVSVRLETPLIAGDRVVFPAGSSVQGKVTGVKPASKGFKDSGGALSVSFDRIVSPDGRHAAIVAGFTMVAEGSGKKKAAIIGGSAAGGAVLGKALDKDAAGAALIGGAIGAAIAGSTKGKEAVLEAGQRVDLTLEEPLRVTVPR
jgi:hypothetical protein